MKKKFVFTIFLIFAAIPLQAVLIIFEKNDKGEVIPLAEKPDENIKTIIWDSIQKYEWPMCVAHAPFSDDIKADLFAPEAYAEEKYIQKIINDAWREIINQNSSAADHYLVIFVPTAFYELFIIDELLQPQNRWSYKQQTIDLFDELTKDEMTPWADIWGKYFNANTQFKDIYFTINTAVGARFLNDVQECADAQQGAETIKSVLTQEISILLDSIREQYENQFNTTAQTILLGSVKYLLQQQSVSTLLEKIIALEYQAREKNAGLLFRGTRYLQLDLLRPLEKQKNDTHEFVGSTFHHSLPLSLREDLGTRPILPFSVSFGNSLFAGSVYDKEASVFYHLTRHQKGYALFINKQDYINDHCRNLFFIAPLSPLAALFGNGEFFHSRAKAAIKKNKNNPIENFKTHGLLNKKKKNLIDPTKILFIERDPLLHAAYFSQFIAHHGAFISINSNTTQEEMDKTREFQEEASVQYLTLRRKIRTIQRQWQRRVRLHKFVCLKDKEGKTAKMLAKEWGELSKENTTAYSVIAKALSVYDAD